MTGVGDELLLPLGGLHHRLDCPPGAEHDNAVNQQNAAGHRARREDGQQTHRAHFLVIIQKNRHPAILAVLHDIIFVPARVAEACAVRQRKIKVFLRVLLSYGGNFIEIGLGERAVRGVAQNKIACGKGRFLRELPARALLRRLPARNGRQRALIGHDGLKHLRQLAVHGDEVCGIDNQAQKQQHGRHGQHGDADEPLAQPPDHLPSSST